MNLICRVACRQLGYFGRGRVLDEVQPGTGQIWLDDIRCRGDEIALDDCQHRGWGVHNCAHNKDVGIHCSVSFPTTSTAASTTLATTRRTTVSTIQVTRPAGTCMCIHICRTEVGIKLGLYWHSTIIVMAVLYWHCQSDNGHGCTLLALPFRQWPWFHFAGIASQTMAMVALCWHCQSDNGHGCTLPSESENMHLSTYFIVQTFPCISNSNKNRPKSEHIVLKFIDVQAYSVPDVPHRHKVCPY